jgi:hypothetical protein
MNTPRTRWLAQALAVTRLTMRKTLFARRSMWVYLLAFAPLVLFVAHTLYAPRQEARVSAIAADHRVSLHQLTGVHVGAKVDDVIARLGEPYSQRAWQRRAEDASERHWRLAEHRVCRYTDGTTDFSFHFVDGVLDRIRRQNPESLTQNTLVFATIFQVYYLRLAVFFGCVGIFTNLFRGEMLDKSLHFYLLTPMRRETILMGKFVSGLIAAVVIFTPSAVLQYAAVLARFDHASVADFLSSEGWAQVRAYAGVTALACVAYGSIFLGAGLFFRNPIIPAAVVLVWESVNIFVPVTLKKLGLIYYLQSLCPVSAAPDADLPVLFKALILDAPPVSTAGAVAVILVVAALTLLAASVRVRRIEITYGTD